MYINESISEEFMLIKKIFFSLITIMESGKTEAQY